MDGQRPHPRLSAAETLQQLGSSKLGLTVAEAHKRLKHHGGNTLQHPPSGWVRFAVGLLARDAFFLILLAALAGALYLGDPATKLGVAVALAVTIAATAGELNRSYRFLQQLEQLLTFEVTVIRGGKQLQVPSRELVLGDIVYFTQGGDPIAADMRLLDTEKLVISEQNITGRNAHIAKSAGLSADNIVFMGSRILAGSGHGVVIALGTYTELGRQVDSVEKLVRYTGTPALAQLQRVRQRLGYAALGLLTLLLLFILAMQLPFHTFVQLAVLLAVAAVPTGLSAAFALQRRTVSTSSRLLEGALSDVSAKTVLAIASVIGLTVYHVPVALPVVLMVAFDVLVMLPATLALGSASQKRAMANGHLIGFGLLSAALAYANYLLFFQRQHITPGYLDASSTPYFQAATLVFLTFALCRIIYVFMLYAADRKQFFIANTWRNPHLMAGVTLGLLLLVGVIYWQPAQQSIHAATLTFADWFFALVIAACYFAIQLLQRHTRQHTRKAVLELHRKVAQKQA